MGACECENPMEFGYEVNSTVKEKEKEKENIKLYPILDKEYFIKN